jgi:hypothetical protein
MDTAYELRLRIFIARLVRVALTLVPGGAAEGQSIMGTIGEINHLPLDSPILDDDTFTALVEAEGRIYVTTGSVSKTRQGRFLGGTVEFHQYGHDWVFWEVVVGLTEDRRGLRCTPRPRVRAISVADGQQAPEQVWWASRVTDYRRPLGIHLPPQTGNVLVVRAVRLEEFRPPAWVPVHEFEYDCPLCAWLSS